MVNVRIEKDGQTTTGHGFRVHLNVELIPNMGAGCSNGEIFRDRLTDVGRKIVDGIRKIPGIDREIMISRYYFETGIAHAFNGPSIFVQVLHVLADALGETESLNLLLPEGPKTVSLKDSPQLLAANFA